MGRRSNARPCPCIIKRAGPHQQDELLTAIPGQQVALTQLGLSPLRNLFKHLIANRMTIRIVDMLEVINIKYQNSECVVRRMAN